MIHANQLMSNEEDAGTHDPGVDMLIGIHAHTRQAANRQDRTAEPETSINTQVTSVRSTNE